jgi:hypothetical protein
MEASRPDLQEVLAHRAKSGLQPSDVR